MVMEVLLNGERMPKGGSGIVYCRTRERCESFAADISGYGIRCAAYHAGLSNKVREKVYNDWMVGKVHVIVATISFGMGVDKSDVRCVVHWDLPKTLTGYYQESGRAGPTATDLGKRQAMMIILTSRASVTSRSRSIGVEEVINDEKFRKHTNNQNLMPQCTIV
ncbi:ATP-dependent DNA helicase RecQ [Trichinella spiralis]|uniref:ATP-dependent DNA helicase RecQ n=1 Tax=Trichinella spiralis TaxID=6334 RepID=UPI0001EFEFA1|nr:ATP-dependent DNA helicase RecQ [Trichinella spiralis]